MSKLIHGLLDRIFAVFGALTLSQAPTFMQDYTQQLSGHVAELHHQISILTQAAEQSGKTLGQFIQKFKDNTDLDYAVLGMFMQEMVERYTKLSNAYTELIQSSVFTRPFVFMKYLDWDIARLTYENFQFGLSLTFEGLVYILLGLYLGVAVYYICSGCLVFACRPLFKKKQVEK